MSSSRGSWCCTPGQQLGSTTRYRSEDVFIDRGRHQQARYMIYRAGASARGFAEVIGTADTLKDAITKAEAEAW